MAFTATDLTAIDGAIKAIAGGAVEQTVRFADGREVTYRSADDLLKLRRLIASEAAPAGQKRIRQVRLYSTKGL